MQGDDWISGDVFLGHMENFQISIKAEKYNNNNGYGDIALDDIKFENCEPPSITGKMGCSKTVSFQ